MVSIVEPENRFGSLPIGAVICTTCEGIAPENGSFVFVGIAGAHCGIGPVDICVAVTTSLPVAGPRGSANVRFICDPDSASSALSPLVWLDDPASVFVRVCVSVRWHEPAM